MNRVLQELGSPYLFRRPLSLSAVKRAASNRRCAACLDVIGGVLPAGLTGFSGLGALSSAMVRGMRSARYDLGVCCEIDRGRKSRVIHRGRESKVLSESLHIPGLSRSN